MKHGWAHSGPEHSLGTTQPKGTPNPSTGCNITMSHPSTQLLHSFRCFLKHLKRKKTPNKPPTGADTDAKDE